MQTVNACSETKLCRIILVNNLCVWVAIVIEKTTIKTTLALH